MLAKGANQDIQKAKTQPQRSTLEKSELELLRIFALHGPKTKYELATRDVKVKNKDTGERKYEKRKGLTNFTWPHVNNLIKNLMKNGYVKKFGKIKITKHETDLFGPTLDGLIYAWIKNDEVHECWQEIEERYGSIIDKKTREWLKLADYLVKAVPNYSGFRRGLSFVNKIPDKVEGGFAYEFALPLIDSAYPLCEEETKDSKKYTAAIANYPSSTIKKEIEKQLQRFFVSHRRAANLVEEYLRILSAAENHKRPKR